MADATDKYGRQPHSLPLNLGLCALLQVCNRPTVACVFAYDILELQMSLTCFGLIHQPHAVRRG
jgi:hypothetical protein